MLGLTAFQYASIFCTALTFGLLLYLSTRRTHYFIRPSFLFLGLFFLQVQLASAINADKIFGILLTAGQTAIPFTSSATDTQITKLRFDEEHPPSGAQTGLRFSGEDLRGVYPRLGILLRLRSEDLPDFTDDLIAFSAELRISGQSPARFVISLGLPAAPNGFDSFDLFQVATMTDDAGAQVIRPDGFQRLTGQFALEGDQRRLLNERGAVVVLTGHTEQNGDWAFDLTGGTIGSATAGETGQRTWQSDQRWKSPILAYLVLVQIFPLMVLAIITTWFGDTAREQHARLSELREGTNLHQVALFTGAMAGLIVIVLIVYFQYVPWHQTGLYAAIFEPALYDGYRELSLKLLDQRWLQYLFAFMEKIFAPLGGASSLVLLVRAIQTRRFAYAGVALFLLLFCVGSASISGARGPGAMVLVTAIFAYLLIFVPKLTPARLTVAFLLCLTPAIAVGVLKSGDLSPRSIAFESLNIFDRVIGRTYVDNMFHLSYIAEADFHGIAGIEKLAPFFGEEPKNILNITGRSFKFASFGFDFIGNAAGSLIESGERVLPTLEIPIDDLDEFQAMAASVDLSETVSAGAAFQILNFTMFGWWSVPVSLAFLCLLDLVLLLYRRMSPAAIGAVAAALAVPVLALCFSLMTTTLLSKGLVIIPVVGYLGALILGRTRSDADT